MCIIYSSAALSNAANREVSYPVGFQDLGASSVITRLARSDVGTEEVDTAVDSKGVLLSQVHPIAVPVVIMMRVGSFWSYGSYRLC